MARTFKQLVEKYGVPLIVIPNTPKVLFYLNAQRVRFSGQEVPPIAKTECGYQRRVFGQEDFLLIKTQRSVPFSAIEKAVAELEEKGISIVEYNRYLWAKEFVGLTLSADVTPISRADLLQAIDKRQTLCVDSWRVMGDGYVEFRTGMPAFLDSEEGYRFFFPSAGAGLTDSEIPDSGNGNDYDSLFQFFVDHNDYFVRDGID